MAAELKVVLVGCGGISRAWLRGMKEIEGLTLVGMVDLVEEMARQRVEDFGITGAVIGTDLEAVLHQTEPDIVFNCTIPEAHLAVSLTALQGGYHVLSEKPLANSMAEARQLVAAAEDAGKLFAVIQNRRFDSNIRRLARFLRSGVLGEITTINSDFYIGAHFGGFRDHMPHVLLLDMAIHTFDAARLIADADPVSVFCKEWNPAGSWYDCDASAIAIFELSRNIVYTYRGSWCAEGVSTTWEADWRIIGTKGTVTWDGGTGFKVQVVGKEGGFMSELADLEIPAPDAADKIGSHAGQIADFVNCVRAGTPPETSGSDNIKSLAMVFGAIESAEKELPVSIG